MKNIAFLFVGVISVSLSAKCIPLVYSKGEVNKDIVNTFKEYQRLPLELKTNDGLTHKGIAKISFVSSNAAIFIDKECSQNGECFKVRGFVSNGEISSLPVKIDPDKGTITLKKGTKFEVVKGDDERWNHNGEMPKCNAE